jgi:hypothetical protein
MTGSSVAGRATFMGVILDGGSDTNAPEGIFVEVVGIEPTSSRDLSGLLRAQPTVYLARRLPQAEHRRTSLAEMSRAGREAHPAR